MAYAMSVKRLTTTKTTLRNRMLPWIAGRSRLPMASSTYRPMPGHAKIVSVRIEPVR